MKILVTADLHLGITTLAVLEEFAKSVRKQKPDVVVIAGDIGESLQSIDRIKQCLALFNGDFDLLTMFGNHDLWVPPWRIKDSAWLWEHLPDELSLGSNYLERHNWIREKIAIVGSYLHYDYSAQDHVGPLSGHASQYFHVNKRTLIPNEFKYLRGLPPDIEFAKAIGVGFRQRLLEAENDSRVEKIIVVTHVPCMEEQITRRPFDVGWSSATPYFGNLSHQFLIRHCRKVSHIVSAHSHQGSKVGIADQQGGLIINLDSDYGSPNWEIIEI